MQLCVCLSIKVDDNKHSYKTWCEVQIPLWCKSAKTRISTKMTSELNFQESLDDLDDTKMVWWRLVSVLHLGKTKTSVNGLATHCTVSVRTISDLALFDENVRPSSTDSTIWSSRQKATGTIFTSLCSRQRERLGSEEPQPSKAATSP